MIACDSLRCARKRHGTIAEAVACVCGPQAPAVVALVRSGQPAAMLLRAACLCLCAGVDDLESLAVARQVLADLASEALALRAMLAHIREVSGLVGPTGAALQ